MKKKSLVSMSVEYLKENGYSLVLRVESWNSFSRTKKDFAGIFDIVAFRKNETLGVQVTSKSNISSRRNKISEHESTPHVRDAGWGIHIHGWFKDSDGSFKLKIEDVS